MAKIAILGAGISGLAHAYYLLKKHTDLEIEIFEANQVGGSIASVEYEGCTFEKGPETYQAKNPLIFELSKELGIESEIIQANKSEQGKRFLIKDGRATKMPTGTISFLLNSFMFFPKKFKAISALKKSFSLWRTMSVFDVAKIIFAEQFAEYFASGFSRGVYGCEAEDLEFSSAFPELYTKLSGNKSIKQSLKEIREEAEAKWKKHLGEASYSNFKPNLISYKKGLSTLTNALKDKLESQGVNFNSANLVRVLKAKNQYNLQAKKQKFGAYDKIISTLDPVELAKIIKENNKQLSVKLSEMRYSLMAVIIQAWPKKKFSQSGFGVLAPRKEKLPILGTLFSSNIFEGRVPKDIFLTKTMIAGDTSLFKDEEISQMAYNGIRRIYKVNDQPLWSRVYKAEPGLPRYFSGYSDLKDEINKLLDSENNLYLRGWHFTGIGLPDCLEAAFDFAQDYQKLQ